MPSSCDVVDLELDRTADATSSNVGGSVLAQLRETVAVMLDLP